MSINIAHTDTYEELTKEGFPIVDFYLKHCAEKNIKGLLRTDLKLLDVGKLDTLEKAEDFLANI